MKLGMYVLAPDPISTAYFTNPPISPCVYMCIPLLLLGNEYTCSYRKIVGCVVFCVIRILSEESRWLILPRTSCFTFSAPSYLKTTSYTFAIGLWVNCTVTCLISLFFILFKHVYPMSLLKTSHQYFCDWFSGYSMTLFISIGYRILKGRISE
jgi:hypothetical protein